jgi:hypothetical protein
MKMLKCLMIVVGMFFAASFVFPAWGQLNPQPEPPRPQSITLPEGTKVEKLGAGHFKFKLPDGRIVEVKGLQKSKGGTAIIGDSGIYDPTGKLISSGKGGNLKGGPKPAAEGKFLKIDSRKVIKIDDEPTWLPATITFQVETKTKSLSPQPDPPGKK